MIRILTYQEHPRGKEIFDRYLYLAAYVLPFSPEDVLEDDVLEVDGETITAQNFLQKSGKKPRKRTKEYQNLLISYGFSSKPKPPQRQISRKDRFKQDRLLAAELIRSADYKLYNYLYDTGTGASGSSAMPRIRRENLRTLLTVKMDVLDAALEAIGTIGGDCGKLLTAEVFRYIPFSASNHVVKLLEAMDVNVCPYCNRLYTMTLTRDGEKSRPQFDHYKSKSLYPHFAISLMNLVPSCGLCNQGKGDRDEAVLYPYSDEMGLDAVFITKPETGVNYLTGNQDALDEFSVKLQVADSLSKELREKIRQSDEAFNLTALYNQHKDYILYLFWKKYVFSDEYLQMLLESFPEVFHSLQDVKSMIYLMDIEQPQWGRRSLAKLTHDIDLEMSVGAK